MVNWRTFHELSNRERLLVMLQKSARVKTDARTPLLAALEVVRTGLPYPGFPRWLRRFPVFEADLYSLSIASEVRTGENVAGRRMKVGIHIFARIAKSSADVSPIHLRKLS